MKYSILLRSALLAALSAASIGAAYAQMYIEAPSAPPPVRVEVMPPPPVAHGYVWDKGHWRWDHGQYVWVPGHWQAERHGWHWVPAHWDQRGPHWRYVEGHWAR